jgi:histidine triad (HIT) family protein
VITAKSLPRRVGVQGAFYSILALCASCTDTPTLDVGFDFQRALTFPYLGLYFSPNQAQAESCDATVYGFCWGRTLMEKDCVFCRIIAGEQHGAFVYENQRVVAFLDINQAVPGHTLIVPRVHVAYWWDLPDDDIVAVAVAAKPIMQALREVFAPPGMLVEQRNGRPAGQEVFHMHLHLIPRGIGKGAPLADPAVLNQRAVKIRSALGRIAGLAEDL